MTDRDWLSQPDPYLEDPPMAPPRSKDAEDPGGQVVIPADAQGPAEPTQQPITLGEMVEVMGPGDPDPRATGRMPAEAMRHLLVEVGVCSGCGTWYPKEVRDPLTDCPSCMFASGLPVLTEEAQVAMEQLRWRLDDYQRWRERDRTKEHEAFVAYCAATYQTAPILLAFLETVYGSQVVKGVHAMSTGGLPDVD